MKYIVKRDMPKFYNANSRIVWVGYCKQTAMDICKRDINCNIYQQEIKTQVGGLYL